MYVIVGTILGTLYHAFKERNNPRYSFEDEGGLAVAFGIFWPIGCIIFITYHSYKSNK